MDLYSQLKANEEAKEEEYQKKYAERNTLKGLEEDELEYLKDLERRKQKAQQEIQSQVRSAFTAQNVPAEEPQKILSRGMFKVTKTNINKSKKAKAIQNLTKEELKDELKETEDRITSADSTQDEDINSGRRYDKKVSSGISSSKTVSNVSKPKSNLVEDYSSSESD